MVVLWSEDLICSFPQTWADQSDSVSDFSAALAHPSACHFLIISSFFDCNFPQSECVSRAVQ